MAKLKTGRHTGAQKAHRQSDRRAIRNRSGRKALRVATKDLLEAVGSKNGEQAKTLLPKVTSMLDKAARKGLFHWKAVARKKSQLARKVGSLAVPAP